MGFGVVLGVEGGGGEGEEDSSSIHTKIGALWLLLAPPPPPPGSCQPSPHTLCIALACGACKRGLYCRKKKQPQWGQGSNLKPTTRKLGKDLYTHHHPHKHTHRYLKPHVPSTLPNYSLSPDTPYCWQPDKPGLTTPCLMEAPSNFIPLPPTHALPLIGPNEATVNYDYDSHHAPIVATCLVDVGASPHIHLIQPLGDAVGTPLLINFRTEAKCLPDRV